MRKERAEEYAIGTIKHQGSLFEEKCHDVGTADTLESDVMTREPYEVFEHTADIGIHANGITLVELFIHAAQGMESLMVDPVQVHPVTSRDITAEGHDSVSLLIAWLNELIFLFDTEYLLFRDFVIESITETRVVGRATGELYDRWQHDLSSAIKAVTWHEASIIHTDDGYRARIIFDL